MGSFSFGSGNAAQLARIPLHLLGALATKLIPRRADAWVFGCAIGIGEGALALWPHVASAGHPAVWLVDSAEDAADAARRGIPTARRDSLRGFWLTARARFAVVTHGAGDVNRYALDGAFLVQLWHGIPLKRIGLDSSVTARAPLPIPGLSRLVRAAYRRTQRRLRLIPAASHLVRGTDVLFDGDAVTRRERARDVIAGAVGDVGDSRLVLYAPTWRDGAADPAVPTEGQWEQILEVLDREDAVLLVRSHPLGAGDYRTQARGPRVRSLGSDLLPEVTPVLPGIDVLITDYSSLVFDTALVPLPVVYLAPDEADYAATRGFYGDYRAVAGPEVAADWSVATAQLATVLSDEEERSGRVERARALSRRVHAHRDGRSAERVYRAIVQSWERKRR